MGAGEMGISGYGGLMTGMEVSFRYNDNGSHDDNHDNYTISIVTIMILILVKTMEMIIMSK